MQVILSVPMPSDCAIFDGHILSSICSTHLAIPSPLEVAFVDAFEFGELYSPEGLFVGLFLPGIPFLTRGVLVGPWPDPLLF
jgi:hypothetical protein